MMEHDETRYYTNKCAQYDDARKGKIKVCVYRNHSGTSIAKNIFFSMLMMFTFAIKLQSVENMTTQKRVFKTVLSNGLTVLIHQKKASPKVALQMWYNVGSKHEQQGEKGMAHFLEHMIFKGTDSMLSEADINAVSQKLAAYANAFTSYDYTAYVFDVPVANWDKMLPIYADCMQNCSFLQDHMNSEVQAVIQELKMYRDDYHWVLADGLITNIFESHPYHYPIIGYKQDLWNLQRETFFKFYHKYYVPNNAAFVVVGDVDPVDALAKIEAVLGTIPRGQDVVHPEFFFNDELQSKSFSIYRELEQAFCMMSFVVPGGREKKDFIFDIIGSLLANGKGSRLHTKLVDELELAISVSAMCYGLFERGIFFLSFKPKHEKDIPAIKEIIFNEIKALAYEPIPEEQMRRAIKIAQIDYQHLLEDTTKQASAIGAAFTGFQDEEYPFDYCNYNPDTIVSEIQTLLQRYFRPSLCFYGEVVKAAQEDKPYLQQLQEESDALDTKILSGKERKTLVEGGRYVDSVIVEKLPIQKFPHPEEYMLANGLKVLLYHNDEVDLAECALRYKADYQYDTPDLQGIGHLVAKMMMEGTMRYPGLSFVQEAESYGITLYTNAGHIECSMLSADLPKGLDLIGEMVQGSTFDASAFDRIKNVTKSQLVQFWDTPKRSINQVVAEHVYGKHPYANMSLGTQESLQKISKDMAYAFYKKVLTPQDSVLVVAGNFDPKTIKQNIEQHFGQWTGSKVESISYPALSGVHQQTIDIMKQRDQIVVAFAGISVDRLSEEYDPLLIFNQLLTVGMNSYLFLLREQSGLFYSVGGSLLHGSGTQPGMIFIKTIVSKDRLQEAQDAISSCLDNSVDRVTEQEFDEAKEMVINTFPALFETNEATANTFMFLDKYKLPYDYFEKRISTIRAMKLEDMKQVVRQYLNSKKLLCVRIGRI